MRLPDIELLREWFTYEPSTGALYRNIKLNSRVGDTVPLDKRMYFKGRRFPYSHIVWAIHHGKWPDCFIDHKDHNQLNFKLDNLREANESQNQHNKVGWSPYAKGIAYDASTFRNKPWVARISVNGISIYLGSFVTKEEAAQAYRVAAIKYHGEFACLK